MEVEELYEFTTLISQISMADHDTGFACDSSRSSNSTNSENSISIH